MANSRRIFLLLLLSLSALQSFTHGSRHSYGHGRSHGHHRDSYEHHYPRHRSRHSSSRPSNQIGPERAQNDEKLNQDSLMTPYKNPVPDYSKFRSINVKQNASDDKSDDRYTFTTNGLSPDSDKDNEQAGTIIINGQSPDDDSNSADGIINANGLSSDDDKIGSPENKPDSENNSTNNDEIIPTYNGNGDVSVDGKLPSNNAGKDGKVDELLPKNPNLSEFPNGNDKPYQDNLEMDEITSNVVKIIPSDNTPRPDYDKSTYNNPEDKIENINGGEVLDNDKTEPDHILNVGGSSRGSDKDEPNNIDDSNDIGLLPGGDGKNPDQGSSDVDQVGLTDLGEPDYFNTFLDGYKPNGHRPGTSDINNGLSTGIPQNIMPDTIRPSSRPNHHNNNKQPQGQRPGHWRPKEPNDNADGNNPVLVPVYLLDNSGRLTTLPQKNQEPAFYIVMIDGHATLVRNPGFVGGKPINGGAASIVDVLPHQPVPVPQIIPPTIYPQPVPYPIPEPGGPFIGYPNMPYPYPWPQMYPNLPNGNTNLSSPWYPNSPNQNMNWPGIVEFLINLGQHLQQPPTPVPKPEEPNLKGKSELPINDNNPQSNPDFNDKPTLGQLIPNEESVRPHTERPIPEPDQTLPTVLPPEYEPLESGSTEIPSEPDNDVIIYPKPDVTEDNTIVSSPKPDANDVEPFTPGLIVPIPNEQHVQPDTDIITNEPNQPEEPNKPTPRPTNPDLSEDNELGDEWPPIFDEKPIPLPGVDEHVHIPIVPKPNHSGKTEPKLGSFDIALLDILNKILKIPNRLPSPKPKPSKDEGAIVKLLHAILKPNSAGKDIDELLQKISTFSPVSQQLIKLLISRTPPNLNILAEPGMKEPTRSNIVLLLNLLASNLASDYSPSMAYYEQMNAANPLLNFLGHIPCDHRNIRPLSNGPSGLRNNLWHMLSNMYGSEDVNPFRLERSAGEDENKKATTPTPIDIKK